MKNRKIHYIVKVGLLTTIILIAMNSTIFNQTVLSDDEVYRLIDQIPGQEATMVGHLEGCAYSGGGLGGYPLLNSDCDSRPFSQSQQCNFNNVYQIILHVCRHIKPAIFWSEPDIGLARSNVHSYITSYVSTRPNEIFAYTTVNCDSNNYAEVVIPPGPIAPGSAPHTAARGQASANNEVIVPFQVLYTGIVEMDITYKLQSRSDKDPPYYSNIVGVWKIMQGSTVLYSGSLSNTFNEVTLYNKPIDIGEYILKITYHCAYGSGEALAIAPDIPNDEDNINEDNSFSVTLNFHV